MSGEIREERDTGTVKWFSVEKGFGFIIPDRQIGEDVFVHITEVKSSGLADLAKDAKVSFNIRDNRGRPAATKLKVDS